MTRVTETKRTGENKQRRGKRNFQEAIFVRFFSRPYFSNSRAVSMIVVRLSVCGPLGHRGIRE